MIQAVLFDIDGTLLDHDAASHASLRLALERERRGLGDEAHAEAVAEWQRLEALHYGEYLTGEIALEEQRRRRAGGILGWLGAGSREPSELDRWFEAFLDGYRAHWSPFPDVEPALAALERAGARLGAITNAVAELQWRKLEALGLADRLPVLIASSEVGVAKPDAAIFAAACDAMGLPADRVAYVGDRPDTDARGARDAGLLGVWIKRDPDRAPARDVATISDLRELEGLLGLEQ